MNTSNPIIDNLRAQGVDPAVIEQLEKSAAIQSAWTHPDTGKLYTGREAIAMRKSYDNAQRRSSSSRNTTPETPVHVVPDTDYWLSQFLTQDPVCLKLKENVKRLSVEQDPVLIHGETGTGKEIIAKALHGSRTGQFVAINCGGFPEYLFESEMFGHVKGSFTGAIDTKVGLLQQAENGTVFIDEIHNLPIFMQNKLLRALQEKTIRRVGDNHEIKINCRIVSATNTELPADDFKDDLYWRISTIELFIPSLRDRKGDAQLIAQHLHKGNTTLPDVWGNLPGNVRELQRIIRRKELGI